MLLYTTKEPMTRFELVTSSLPRKRSTPELHRLFKSGRRGSNSRHSAWKADALPTELLPLVLIQYVLQNSGENRIRTCEGENQQIYSLPSLAAWVSPQMLKSTNNDKHWAGRGIRTHDPEITNHVLWPTELYRQIEHFPYKKQVFFTSPLRGANIQQFFIPPTKIFVFFKISY